MYVMKWSRRDDTYNHPEKHGHFVGIDTNSGGYPWACGKDFNSNVEIWHDIEDAKSFQKHFPCLDIMELKVLLKEMFT